MIQLDRCQLHTKMEGCVATFKKRRESDGLGRPSSVSCNHLERLIDELNLTPNLRTATPTSPVPSGSCAWPRIPGSFFAPRGESQIRLTGKVFALKALAVAHTMCQTSHSHFRLRIPSLDGPHHLTALFRAFRHFRILIFRLGSVPMSSAWRWARPTSRPGSFDDGS